MDLEVLEARKRGCEDNLPCKSCCLFRQRGIASRLLRFRFDNFSQARRSYYLFFTTCSYYLFLLLVRGYVLTEGFEGGGYVLTEGLGIRGVRFDRAKLRWITAICGQSPPEPPVRKPQERFSAVRAP